MITKMLLLVAFWLVGYLVSVLVSWVRSPKGFEFKSVTPAMVLSVLLGVIAAFFASKIALDGWLLWAIFAIGGFASGGVIKFVTKKNDQINP